MLSAEENHRLTRIVDGAPMGRLLLEQWVPLMRSAALVADGAPVRFTLCGVTAIAFRNSEGRIGVLDEHCPHRCASLKLGRNEENGLRCIFHGWKFDVEGRLIDMPTEADASRRERIQSRVRARHYPSREAGGLVWAFLGEGEPPAFQTFEFATLDASHYDIRVADLNCNWLQAMESVLDSAHLGFLHRSSVEKALAAASQQNAGDWLNAPAPRLQVQPTVYGFREAAMRDRADGSISTRIREVVAPWHVILPGETGAERQHIISVPIDDHHCRQIIVTYNPFRPMSQDEIDTLWFDTHPDADNIAQGLPGREQDWGQDRDAMRQGHYSGLTDRHVFCEDFAILESMGSIVDRSREHLMQIDYTISAMRRELLRAMDAHAAGEAPWPGIAEVDFRRLRSRAVVLDAAADWREISAFVDADVDADHA